MELAYKTCQHSAAAPFGSVASQEPCWTHSGTHQWDTTVPPPHSLPQNLRVHFLPLQSAWAPAEKCRAQAFRTGLRQREKKSASTRVEGSQGRTRISPQDCEGFTVPCSLQPCPSVLLCEGELIIHLMFCQPRDGKQSPAPAPGGHPAAPSPGRERIPAGTGFPTPIFTGRDWQITGVREPSLQQASPRAASRW